jgi:hypothetical protein
MGGVVTFADYESVKRLIESHALALRAERPGVHLADACTEVLRANPSLWMLYQQGIRDGMPSEFQRGRRRRAIPTPKDQAWQVIEDLARTLVAASTEPITLRNAVGRVVEVNPDLYQQYANARRRP